MRKAWLGFLIVAIVVVAALATAFEYERRDNTLRVKRAQEIVRELRRLEIGKSDLSEADAIVKQFSNAPLPSGWTKYTKDYCASPDRSENCVYLLSMNNSPLERLFENHPLLRHLRLHGWTGSAMIMFRGAKVSDYRFNIWYHASNGHLRGFGASESQALLKFEPDQARISDSYAVLLYHTVHTSPEFGIGLESALTPSASASEQQRARHVDFSCLAENQGCGEVCEIMPDAWRDFYETLGSPELKRRGPDYVLCNESSK